jgi:hypothetical protein
LALVSSILSNIADCTCTSSKSKGGGTPLRLAAADDEDDEPASERVEDVVEDDTDEIPASERVEDAAESDDEPTEAGGSTPTPREFRVLRRGISKIAVPTNHNTEKSLSTETQ